MVKPGGNKKKKKIVREVARAINKSPSLHKRFLMAHPYALSLLDPFHYTAKIPDEVTTPSCTFTIVDRRELTVNAQGVAGICYGFYGLNGGSRTAGGLVPTASITAAGESFLVGMGFGTTATDADLTASTGIVPIYFSQWGSGATGSTVPSTVSNQFSHVRLVSAGLQLQYLGAPLGAKGKITMASCPRNYSRPKGNLALGISDIAKIPQATVTAINQFKCATARYFPQDPISLSYCHIGQGTSGYLEYSTASVLDYESVPQRSPGELWGVITGATATDIVEVLFVANYEAYSVNTDFSLVSLTPSLTNPIELANTFNMVQSVPKTYVSENGAQSTLSKENAISSGMAVKQPESQPSIMESLTNGLDSASGVLDKLISVGSKVAPYAEGLLALL